MSLLKILLSILALSLNISLSGQIIREVSEEYNKDSLKNIYGKNKEFISEYELQCLIALSNYPELVNAKISFRLADKESMAKTTITFFSIFNRRDKHFIIYINNNRDRTGVLLKDAPFNAQVGTIGHELAHAVDFKNKHILEMGLWGIKYLNKKHTIKIERKTDMATIEHNLGWQLYDFVDFVLNNSTANEEYKLFKKQNYLQPNEILRLIQNIPLAQK